MIDFKPLTLENRAEYDRFLFDCGERGCEYSFVNLYLWGRQQAAVHSNHLLFFSQFNRRSVYLFPIGTGDLCPALDAVIEDAAKRGIPCRFTGLTHDDCAMLEQLYPGRFHYHFDRDGFDYIYDINDLADLKGRKFQRKRNHLNRFRQNHPNCSLIPVTPDNLETVKALVTTWYTVRLAENPHADYLMEQAAIHKALHNWQALKLEGLLLMEDGQPLAVAIGSLLSPNTFDIHFEKALDIADGAYPAINQSFASYLREKYPHLQWLNREDDMGLEGLRKAKLSYCPDHMIEKNWACLLEECYDY